MRILLISFLFCANILSVYAQDPQFSQYYAAPLYLNPAMAGTTPCDRAVANARTQWTALPKPFNTFAVSIDINYSDIHSGFGLMALHDNAGLAEFSSDEVSLFYSYLVPINKYSNVRMGIQGIYVNRSINYSQLIFEDQFFGTSVVNNNTIDPVAENTRASYFDMAAGILIFDEERYWVGASLHHLNEPNQAFYTGESKLPRRLTIHGGYHISFFDDHGLHKVTDKSVHLTPTFLYKSQERYDQFDFGVYLLKTQMLIGLWYRGIYFKEDEGIRNRDAVVLQAGFKSNDFAIIYSYDLTVSGLGLDNTAGSHEISLTYEFCSNWPKKRKKNYKKLPCPDFLKSTQYESDGSGF